MNAPYNEVLTDYLDLVNKLNKCNYQYHVLDNPTISDEEYDILYSQLLKWEDKYPMYVSHISPSGYCGAPPKNVLDSMNVSVPKDKQTVMSVRYKPDTTKITAVEYTGDNEEIVKFILGDKYTIDKRPTRLIITQEESPHWADVCMLGDYVVYEVDEDYLHIFSKEEFEKTFEVIKNDM